MTVQSTVNLYPGFGVAGALYDDGPRRVQPFTLNSADASYNVFGRAFTVLSEGVAQAGNPGGSNIFAGILVNPKAAPLFGTSSGALFPSLTLPNYSPAELLREGSIVVALAAAAAIGDVVIYDNTTGILATIAPGVALPSGKSNAYAYVDRFTVTAAGLAVITLLRTPALAS